MLWLLGHWSIPTTTLTHPTLGDYRPTLPNARSQTSESRRPKPYLPVNPTTPTNPTYLPHLTLFPLHHDLLPNSPTPSQLYHSFQFYHTLPTISQQRRKPLRISPTSTSSTSSTALLPQESPSQPRTETTIGTRPLLKTPFIIPRSPTWRTRQQIPDGEMSSSPNGNPSRQFLSACAWSWLLPFSLHSSKWTTTTTFFPGFVFSPSPATTLARSSVRCGGSSSFPECGLPSGGLRTPSLKSDSPLHCWQILECSVGTASFRTHWQ